VVVVFFLDSATLARCPKLKQKTTSNRTRVGVKGGGSPPLHVRASGEE
jgi:hypothetical protein